MQFFLCERNIIYLYQYFTYYLRANLTLGFHFQITVNIWEFAGVKLMPSVKHVKVEHDDPTTGNIKFRTMLLSIKLCQAHYPWNVNVLSFCYSQRKMVTRLDNNVTLSYDFKWICRRHAFKWVSYVSCVTKCWLLFLAINFSWVETEPRLVMSRNVIKDQGSNLKKIILRNAPHFIVHLNVSFWKRVWGKWGSKEL